MSFSEKHNKGFKFDYILPQDVQYRSLAEAYAEFGKDCIYTVKAVTINTKGRFGDRGCLWVNKDIALNLPQHLTETARQIITDSEDVAAINAGKVGAKIKTYTLKDRPGQTFFTVEWVDL